MIIAFRKGQFYTQDSTLRVLLKQMTEMKAKFEEMEKLRLEREKKWEEIEREKESRLRSSFIEGTYMLFKDMSDRIAELDREKNTRIEMFIKEMKNFFEFQKDQIEKFLDEQVRSRLEIERRRDDQLNEMRKMIDTFVKTVTGTKKRGMTGENILKEALKKYIRSGIVKTNLKTENGEIEFAWDLGDGKYIPIDSKMPEIFELVENYDESENHEDRARIKKEIVEKIKREIRRVKKYQNLSNTIDRCILVVPEVVIEMAPEISLYGERNGVSVCSYKDVFFIVHTIQRQYNQFKEKGDVGKLKRSISVMSQILDDILSKTETIDRALAMIRNANEKIREGIIKSKRVNELELYSTDESLYSR